MNYSLIVLVFLELFYLISHLPATDGKLFLIEDQENKILYCADPDNYEIDKFQWFDDNTNISSQAVTYWVPKSFHMRITCNENFYSCHNWLQARKGQSDDYKYKTKFTVENIAIAMKFDYEPREVELKIRTRRVSSPYTIRDYDMNQETKIVQLKFIQNNEYELEIYSSQRFLLNAVRSTRGGFYVSKLNYIKHNNLECFYDFTRQQRLKIKLPTTDRTGLVIIEKLIDGTHHIALVTGRNGKFKICDEKRQCNLTQDACSSGIFGFDCKSTCRNSQPCSRLWGYNLNCPEEFKKSDCAEADACDDGYFGATCRYLCSDNCLSKKCDKNGNCHSLKNINTNIDRYCKTGFEPPMCYTECKHGLFGEDCKLHCGQNCLDCNNENGCKKCADGYTGSTCKKECPNGYFINGENCYACGKCQSGSCDKITGDCPNSKCRTGYNPPKCINCATGWYWDGNKCKECVNCVKGKCDPIKGCTKCLTNFDNATKCSECIEGWYGDRCESKCSNCVLGKCNKQIGCEQCIEHFDKQNQCLTCKEGYYYKEVKRYYADRSYYTVETCVSCGNCRSGKCNKITGSCPDSLCKDGYKPPVCLKKCDDGWYGINCQLQCVNCVPGNCNKINGCEQCIEHFDKTTNCSSCEEGYYYNAGICVRCGNCRTGNCNKTTGDCLDTVCRVGYTPPNCLECEDDWYGDDCKLKCVNCVKDKCDKKTGCTLCHDNFDFKTQCSSCKFGFHYENGECIPCGHCSSGLCDTKTGNCTFLVLQPRITDDFVNNTYNVCEDSYPPPKCKDCNDGYYVNNDTCKACGNCSSGYCDKISGHCGLNLTDDKKCQDGFIPPLCKIKTKDKLILDNDQLIGTININNLVHIILSTLLIISFIIICILFITGNFHKKIILICQRKNSDNSPPRTETKTQNQPEYCEIILDNLNSNTNNVEPNLPERNNPGVSHDNHTRNENQSDNHGAEYLSMLPDDPEVVYDEAEPDDSINQNSIKPKIAPEYEEVNILKTEPESPKYLTPKDVHVYDYIELTPRKN